MPRLAKGFVPVECWNPGLRLDAGQESEDLIDLRFELGISHGVKTRLRVLDILSLDMGGNSISTCVPTSKLSRLSGG